MPPPMPSPLSWCQRAQQRGAALHSVPCSRCAASCRPADTATSAPSHALHAALHRGNTPTPAWSLVTGLSCATPDHDICHTRSVHLQLAIAHPVCTPASTSSAHRLPDSPCHPTHQHTALSSPFKLSVTQHPCKAPLLPEPGCMRPPTPWRSAPPLRNAACCQHALTHAGRVQCVSVTCIQHNAN